MIFCSPKIYLLVKKHDKECVLNVKKENKYDLIWFFYVDCLILFCLKKILSY